MNYQNEWKWIKITQNSHPNEANWIKINRKGEYQLNKMIWNEPKSTAVHHNYSKWNILSQNESIRWSKVRKRYLKIEKLAKVPIPKSVKLQKLGLKLSQLNFFHSQPKFFLSQPKFSTYSQSFSLTQLKFSPYNQSFSLTTKIFILQPKTNQWACQESVKDSEKDIES